jgi:hypothetical protein
MRRLLHTEEVTGSTPGIGPPAKGLLIPQMRFIDQTVVDVAAGVSDEVSD